MAPKPVLEPKFQPLHDVLKNAYSDFPTILCAFLKSDGNPCNNNVENEDLERTDYWVEKISQYLSKVNDRNSPVPAFLYQLCNYCLCRRHMKHGGHTKFQWLDELRTKRLNEQFVKLLEKNKRWPPPGRVLEFKAIQPGKNVQTWLDTLKRIDAVLERKLTGADKNYLYVLSSPEAVGKFKIGVCKDHPSDKRTEQHLKCYPGSKMIFRMEIPKYAYRVEQLMLAEFKPYHFQLEKACWVSNHGRHREWLNIEEKALIERLREWQEFFVVRPHNLKIYNEQGKFNSAAGPYRPGGSTDVTPTKNEGRKYSRFPTPCDGSPSPSSTAVKDKRKINGNSLQISGRASSSLSSRSSRKINDDPVPFPISRGVVVKLSGKSPQIVEYSTDEYEPTDEDEYTDENECTDEEEYTDEDESADEDDNENSAKSYTTLTWLMRNLGIGSAN